VNRSHRLIVRAGPIAASLLLGSALLLGGCSGRDTSAAEKVAQINAAAERAEKAALRAEAAAAKIEKLNQPTVIEADPDATEDAADADLTEDTNPTDQTHGDGENKQNG